MKRCDLRLGVCKMGLSACFHAPKSHFSYICGAFFCAGCAGCSCIFFEARNNAKRCVLHASIFFLELSDRSVRTQQSEIVRFVFVLFFYFFIISNTGKFTVRTRSSLLADEPSAYTSSRLSVLMRMGGKHTLQRPKSKRWHFTMA